MRLRSGFPEFVTCTLAWGSIGVIVKNVTLSAPVIVFFRLSLGMGVVLIWLAARGRLGELRPRARVPLLVLSGVMLAAHWSLLFEAFKRLDVAAAILIVFVGPVIIAVTAPFVLRERLRANAVIALLVALGGIALIAVPDIGSIDGVGVLLALGSAALFAVVVLSAKVLSRDYGPAALVVWQQGVATIVMAPALTGAAGAEIWRALPLLLVLGSVYTGALGILFFRAVRALQAQQISVLFYLEPASAVLYAWWLLAEQPSAATLGGGGLIVAAGLAIILGDRVTGPVGSPDAVVVPEEAT